MKSLFAFIKKEGLESVRSGKIILLIIIFVLFGIMNPAIAKLTPWMMEMMADSLDEIGMMITDVEVNALSSWTQFFKNIPLALIAFILLYHSIFTGEYQAGTLIPVLTKGLSRYKVVIAKSVVMLTLWTFCYWLCLGITYGYNEFFWDNGIAGNLFAAGACWWLFGIWVICLVVLFSTISGSAGAVLLGTGFSVLASYLVGLFPKIGNFVPTLLMNGSSLLAGAETPESFIKPLIVTLLLCAGCFAVGVPVMNKRQL